MKNSKLVEITSTLEQIKKANKMIEFHKKFDKPDLNAIANFKNLRTDFVKQLAELLAEYKVKVKIPQVA